MSMINMKMSPKEAQEWAEPTAADAPEYPYGLCIQLDEEGLAKLGITTPPPVGTQLTITARCVVTNTSQYQTQGKENEASVGLQITDMEVGEASSGADAASMLYPSA